jgi:hypothetical protein
VPSPMLVTGPVGREYAGLGAGAVVMRDVTGAVAVGA